MSERNRRRVNSQTKPAIKVFTVLPIYNNLIVLCKLLGFVFAHTWEAMAMEAVRVAAALILMSRAFACLILVSLKGVYLFFPTFMCFIL